MVGFGATEKTHRDVPLINRLLVRWFNDIAVHRYAGSGEQASSRAGETATLPSKDLGVLCGALDHRDCSIKYTKRLGIQAPVSARILADIRERSSLSDK